MKKYLVILSLCLLVLTGCSKATMVINDSNYRTNTPVYVFTENRIELPLPIEESVISKAVPPDGTTCTIEGNALIITPTIVGENQEIKITFTKEGFRDAEAILTFNATLQQYSLSGSYGVDNAPVFNGGSINMEMNSDVSMLLNPATDGVITCEFDAALLNVTVTGNHINLTAIGEGNTKIILNHSAKGFVDSYIELSISVLPYVDFKINGANVTSDTASSKADVMELQLSNKESLSLIIEPVDAKEISVVASSSSPTLMVQSNKNAIILTALAPGVADVDVVISADGYSDVVKKLKVTIIKTKIPVSPHKDWGTHLLSSVGESLSVPIITTGNVQIESATNGITATIANNLLTINSNVVTAGDVTLKVTQDGYLDNLLTFKVSITAAKATGFSKTISDILYYTNLERQKAGFSPLKQVKVLDTLATVRASEASEKWDHTRPNGKSFDTVFSEYGITNYVGKGENLSSANIHESGEEVVRRWMESPSHRENLLKPQFTEIGIGVYKTGDWYYYSQLFAF